MLTSRSAADRWVTSRPPMQIRPELGSSSPAIRRSVRRLAAPGRAEQGDQRAGRDLEADVVHGHDRAVALADARGTRRAGACAMLIASRTRPPIDDHACTARGTGPPADPALARPAPGSPSSATTMITISTAE